MTGGSSKLKRSRYVVYFLAWIAAGLFFFSQDLTRRAYWHDPTPWRHILLSWVVTIFLSASLAPGVLWLGNRWPIEGVNWRRHGALHLMFGGVFAIVQLTLEAGLFFAIGISYHPLKHSFWIQFVVAVLLGFHGSIITYWAVLGIQSALRYYRQYQEREQRTLRLELRASELETVATRAQLSALKMQLQPHFLFNTLNAIVVLVRQRKGREAEEMLARLSDLLRSVLEDVEAQEVPLSRELDHVQLYLAIEQARFPDRLRVELSIDPMVLGAAVPHLCLQPIVENAVRHGIGASLLASTIKIAASRAEETLQVRVIDDGPGFPKAALQERSGVGLSNTRARLKQLYGDKGLLAIANAEPRGTVVTVILPYHLLEDAPTPRIQTHEVNHADR